VPETGGSRVAERILLGAAGDLMPIYEFRCGACGTGFEALVDAGTETVACAECGASASRVYSPPARSPRLVKTRREARKQERANEKLRASAKARFKAARARARAQLGGRGDGNR
jgi:putative FmdB family regulatory protein